MNIILKHTIKSAAKNRSQVIIIILTIALVTAMIFAGFCMTDVFFNLNMSEYNRVAQDADMLLGSNFGDGETFSKSRIENILKQNPQDIASIEYFLKMASIMKTEGTSKTVLIEATDLNKYLASHNLKYVEKYEGSGHFPGADITAEYYPVIVGETFAKTSGLKAGDEVEVYLAAYDMYAKLFIMYIAEDSGIFSASSSINMLLDFSAVNNKGQVNAVYINFTDDALFEEYKSIFDELLPNINCDEGNSITQVKSIVKNNTLLFSVGLVFVVATMMLILLTSYLIIARNRMSEMIIFKASGATPNQVALIMLAEVVMYAIIGSILGLLVGRLGMQIAAMALIPFAVSAITYQVWKYIVAIIIAVVVTVLATLVPIISTSKKTIRESTSNSGKTKTSKGNPIVLAVTAGVFVALVITMQFISGIPRMAAGVIMVADVVVLLIFGTRYFIAFMGMVISKIFKGGAVRISASTVKRNSAMNTIVVLLTVVISFSFIVVEVVDLVKTAVVPFNTRYEADYVVVVNKNNPIESYDKALAKFENECGTDGGYFNSSGFFISGNEGKSFSIYGASNFWVVQHSTKGVSDATRKLWDTTRNPIILNSDILNRLNLKVGDSVEFVIANLDYKDVKYTFKIVGEDSTLTEYDRVGYTKYDVLSPVSGGAIFLLSKTIPTTEFADIRMQAEMLGLDYVYALPYQEWAFIGNWDLSGVGALLSLIQYAMYIIGLLGLVNIIVVTVMDRKQELTLYKLSGMSNDDYMMFALGESAILALSGSTLSIFITFGINQLLPSLSTIIDKFITYPIFPLVSLATAGIGIVLFVASWLAIAFLNRKLPLNSINERLQP